MTTKHTPGPWKHASTYVRGNANILSCEGAIVAQAVYGGDVSMNETAANAARIVACVNACEGIADPSAVKDLLDMCMAAERLLDPMTHNPASDDFMRELRAAISKATGTNQ